jgi:Protein of unknown function (DUF3311)
MRRWHPARLLLILPFIAVLWVPFYNRTQPTLWSLPFYYWYQMLWILLGAVIIGLVYLLEHGTER